MIIKDFANALSDKGRSLASGSARMDMELFMDAASNKYHHEDNPQGAFALNVAENSPMVAAMKRKIEKIFTEVSPDDWIFKYTDALGHPLVREVMADFMNQYFGPADFSAANIAFSAGAAAVIEVSTFVLLNPGDVVVIPAPAYPMYTNDLALKNDVGRYDLQIPETSGSEAEKGGLNVAMLKKTKLELDSQGKKFGMLLITSPDNPTGKIFQTSDLLDMAAWCHQHKIHMVVNEIYALSEWKKEKHDSFATIMATMQSEYLHLWYALSKDFAMSGFRFGLAHSLNQAFMKAYGNANIPHMVSNLTQWIVGTIFQDAAFIEVFIKESKQHLQKSHAMVTTLLEKFELPYADAEGSFFIWADFSRFLKVGDESEYLAFWEEMYRNSGVLLTPELGFGHKSTGYFRIVHTAVSITELSIAMQRLEVFLEEKM